MPTKRKPGLELAGPVHEAMGVMDTPGWSEKAKSLQATLLADRPTPEPKSGDVIYTLALNAFDAQWWSTKLVETMRSLLGAKAYDELVDNVFIASFAGSENWSANPTVARAGNSRTAKDKYYDVPSHHFCTWSWIKRYFHAPGDEYLDRLAEIVVDRKYADPPQLFKTQNILSVLWYYYRELAPALHCEAIILADRAFAKTIESCATLMGRMTIEAKRHNVVLQQKTGNRVTKTEDTKASIRDLIGSVGRKKLQKMPNDNQRVLAILNKRDQKGATFPSESSIRRHLPDLLAK